MNQKETDRKRQRGVVLSPYGINRLRKAISDIEVIENQGKPYLTEELSQKTGVSPSTLSRLWSAKSGIDQKSLRLIFSAFNLEITGKDIQKIAESSPDRNELNLISTVQTSVNPLSYPSGPVPLNSPLYISRYPLEERAYNEITHPGCVVRIKSPSGFGKSSLLLRVLDHGKKLDYETVALNMKQTDQAILADGGRFLQWFCSAVAMKLGKTLNLADYWSEFLGDSLNCTVFMQEQILESSHRPILLCLEELNHLFAYPKTSQAFFPLLRSWREEANHDQVWQKLRQVVSYSTDSYLPLDINQSPFNTGLPLFLPEFTPEQVQDLAQRHQRPLTITELEQLMNWVGGHPTLVRIVLYHLSQEDISLKNLCDTATRTNGIFHNYLQNILVEIQSNPAYVEQIKSLLVSDTPSHIEPILACQLETKGIIKLTEEGWVIRLNLYRNYLQNYM